MTSVPGELILRGCLEKIGCSQHAQTFIDNDIDFDCFKTLSIEELGVLLQGKIGPQKKIYAEIERIREIDAGLATPNKTPTAPPPETVTSMQTPPPTYASTVGGDLKPNFPQPVGGGGAGAGPQASVKSMGPPSPGGQRRTPTTPPIVQNQKPVTATPAEQGLLDKYGFKLPSAGAFATSIAVGTVQKYIIDEIVYNRVFPKDPATTGPTAPPTGDPAPPPGSTPAVGDPGTGVPPVAPEAGIAPPSNPALNAFEASPYGAPNSRSLMPLEDSGVEGDVGVDFGADPGTVDGADYYDGVDVEGGEAVEWDGTTEWDASTGVEFDGGALDGGATMVDVDVDLSSGGEGAGEVVASLFEGIVNIF